jgi:hypothetical protein
VAAFNLYLEDEGWHEFTDTVKRRVQFLMQAAEEAEEDEPEDAAPAEDKLGGEDEDVSDEGDEDEDQDPTEAKRDLIDTLPEDIRQDLVQVSVLLSEHVLNDEEAMLIWTLIQKRDPVVMAAFDVCRQTDNWNDLYDTLMRVLESQANDEETGDTGPFAPDVPLRGAASKKGATKKPSQDEDFDAGSHDAVFRATVSGLRKKNVITGPQAAHLELLYENRDDVLWAALEVHSIMHDTPDLEETFKILAQSQELLQRERELKKRAGDNKDAKSSPHKRKKSDAEVDFSDVQERRHNTDKRRRRDSDDVKERGVVEDVSLEEKKEGPVGNAQVPPTAEVQQKEKEWWDRFSTVFD